MSGNDEAAGLPSPIALLLMLTVASSSDGRFLVITCVNKRERHKSDSAQSIYLWTLVGSELVRNGRFRLFATSY